MENKTKDTYSKLVRYKHRLTSRPTSAELLFKKYLDDFEIPYRFQKGMITNKSKGSIRIVDFYVPRVNIAFEIDGGYHSTTHQEIKDFDRELEINQKRKNVLFVRFTNEEVIKNPDRVKNAIKEVYNERLWDYVNNRRVGQKAQEKYKFIYSPSSTAKGMLDLPPEGGTKT